MDRRLTRKKRSKRVTWREPVPEQKRELPDDLDLVKKLIQEHWQDCDDLNLYFGSLNQVDILIVSLTTMVDQSLVADLILDNIAILVRQQTPVEHTERVIRSMSINTVNTLEDVHTSIAAGMAVVFLSGRNVAYVVNVYGAAGRTVEKPELEPALFGPQEAFSEDIEKDLGLLRKRVQTGRLKVKYVKVGSVGNNRLAVVYLEGIVKPEYVQIIFERLGNIQIDAILDTNYVHELITDTTYSPFPTVQLTERPDRLAAALLEGRIGLLCNGSPVALIAPAVFINFLQSVEDYYLFHVFALPVRFMRHVLFWVSMLMPSVYVALMTFHHEMIPIALLRSILASREGIPFPVIVEAFIMEATFEALREAGLRLPKTVGQSVSIVGALVIGDAAVKASLVSPVMVIVTSLTGIASFSLPSYNLAVAVRVLRFPFMILAAMFGLYGISIAAMVLLAHMVSLQSLGVPYLSPLAPIVFSDMKDLFIRASWRDMRLRPKTIGTPNPYRGDTA